MTEIAATPYTAAVCENSTASIYNKKFRLSDFILSGLINLSAAFAILLLIGIMGYVFFRGLPQISVEFLTTVPSTLKGTFGIAGNILNTIYIILITLLIATPLGVGSAIYLNEYAKPGKLVRIIEFTTETLSGIPSIIFGLFGMVFFGNVLGYSILTGALTLTLMILPLITRNTQEALKTVPMSYRSGALGIGATKWYMIRTILLPSAMPGIITGVILAIGRIVGESAALLFTAGSGFLLPKTAAGLFKKIFESGGTLTIQLYLCMSKAQYDAAFGIAAVLLIIVLFINFLTKVLSSKFDVSKID
ncbi:MAG: phosphate ABC transporter permease PstA [Lachnospiraceae bacterium]|nr:phosphate ABC transporter permease PstA [Lachnospiraceae bacterium]